MRGQRLTTKWPERRAGSTWKKRLRVKEELHQAWASFFGRVPWDVFASLTFDPKRVFPVPQGKASREAFDWCSRLGRSVRRSVAWAYVTERGASGLWHVHALVTDMTVAEVETVAELWRLRNGIVDVRSVFDTEGLILYLSKSTSFPVGNSGLGSPPKGELVFSDTVVRYRDRLCPEPVIALVGQEDSVTVDDKSEPFYLWDYREALDRAFDSFFNGGAW